MRDDSLSGFVCCRYAATNRLFYYHFPLFQNSKPVLLPALFGERPSTQGRYVGLSSERHERNGRHLIDSHSHEQLLIH